MACFVRDHHHSSSSSLQVLQPESSKCDGTSSCSRKFPIFLSRWHRKWTSPAIILVGLKCHHENHLRNPAKVKPGAASFSTRSTDQVYRATVSAKFGSSFFFIFLGFYRFSGWNRQNPRAPAVVAGNFQSFCPGGIANGHHQLSF